MNPVRLRAYLELLLVSAIWGVAAVVIKYTLSGFSPLIFLTYRFFISTIIALVFFAFVGFKFPKNPKTLALTLLNGFLLSTVALGLLFFGTAKTTSIDANLISAMTPILVAIAGVIFLKEHITTREKFGIGIALTGTIISTGFSGFEGNLLVFASVLVTVATAVIAKVILKREVDALFATNIAFIVGFVTTLPIVLFSYRPFEIWNLIISASPKYHFGVIYMAALSGTLAYYLWHKAEKSIEIGEVNLVAYLYPVFGTPLSVLWLKEKITTQFVIGAVIIALGVFLAEWKKRS